MQQKIPILEIDRILHGLYPIIFLVFVFHPWQGLRMSILFSS